MTDHSTRDYLRMLIVEIRCARRDAAGDYDSAQYARARAAEVRALWPMRARVDPRCPRCGRIATGKSHSASNLDECSPLVGWAECLREPDAVRRDIEARSLRASQVRA